MKKARAILPLMWGVLLDRRLRVALLIAFYGLLVTLVLPPGDAWAAPAQQEGDIAGALAGLAKKVIDGLLIASGLLLAIGFATGFVQGQIAVMAGSPYGLSQTWVRIAGIVLCFLGVAFAIPAANALIDAIVSSAPNQTINVDALR
ncbi:MAG TPA: hypothetical protein DCP08_06505 [Chloroflexi bacterium]|nr:hypothetical protein [Chloroflexota bacterium]